MEQVVVDFEKGKAIIAEQVQKLRDAASHLLVEAQKYENGAREFDTKIQIYQQ